MIDREILNKAVRVWGVGIQSVLVMEEMAELTKEISKALRGNNNKTELTQEVGDVVIMLEQLKLIYDLDEEEINKSIEDKMNRLKIKLGEYE